MKRYLTPILIGAVLAVPAIADAKVIELGAGGQPAGQSNCPADPCVAAYQVTAYQGRSGTLANPFVVPRAGKIVAFSVSLGKLTDEQVAFFQSRFGAEPSVRLSILRRSTRKGMKANHRLMSQSKAYDVAKYFGSSPTFALDEPLRVHKDHRVALTVPTWAPVLDTVGLTGTNWWRASRPKGECGKDNDLSPPSAKEELREVAAYGCTYFSSRLLYTATYVPDPRPTDGSDRKKRAKRSSSATAAARAAVASALRAVGGGVAAP